MAALLAAGVHGVDLINRAAPRGRALAAHFGDRRVRAADAGAVFAQVDLIVNATSASLADACPAFPPAAVGAGTLAYDLAYARGATPFMRRAAALGARAVDGTGMLVEQAAESFFLWHGIRPDTTRLRLP